MRIRLDDEEQPEIGLVALIDCIFFLLMFFMVATSFKHEGAGKPPKALPISLPNSAVSLGQASAAPDLLVIGVDAKGGFYWGSERVSQTVLRERLHAAALHRPDRAVRIDGDTRTPYQHIVHLLDLCQFEGLTRIAMRTRDGA